MNLIKKFLSAFLAAAITMSLAACGTNTPTVQSEGIEKKDKEVTEIKFWYAWTDKIQENNIALAEEFNNTVGKEKGIKVVAEYQGTYEDVHQKLQAAYLSDSMPGVSVMEIASIKAFAENNVIEDLTPYINDAKIDMDDFYEGLLTNCKVEDKWYGIPYLRSTPILYLNTTILEEAGLDPSGPKTWDELATYCRTIKEKTGKYGLSMYSYNWTFEAFILEQGKSILTEDEQKVNINTAEAKAALKFFKELVDEGVIRCVAGDSSDKINADIMNQDTAMWFNSTANLTQALQIGSDNGFDVSTCFIPKAKKYGVPTGGCNIVMSSKISDKEKQAAWEFIKWLTATEQSAKASKNTGYVTSRKSATNSQLMSEVYSQYPQFKVALDQLEAAGYGRPMNPGYIQGAKEIVNVMDAVWVNNADIDATVAKAEANINGMLSK